MLKIFDNIISVGCINYQRGVLKIDNNKYIYIYIVENPLITNHNYLNFTYVYLQISKN